MSCGARRPPSRDVPCPRRGGRLVIGRETSADLQSAATRMGGSMLWLFTAPRRLRELGILGMNRRNAACILDHNPRASFPLVDDKLRMHDLCRRLGVPVPEVRAAITAHSQLRPLPPF